MILFLKHIRQRLFLEGQVSKYFGYAVGEIALIVVRILSALEANEWKEERKDRIEEKQILGRISDEFNLIISDASWMLSFPAWRKGTSDRIAGHLALGRSLVHPRFNTAYEAISSDNWYDKYTRQFYYQRPNTGIKSAHSTITPGL